MVWRDQGLYFTLLLNVAALSLLVPLVYFLVFTKKLSFARIYRPNHTALPENIDDYMKSEDSGKLDALAENETSKKKKDTHSFMGIKFPAFSGGSNCVGYIIPGMRSAIFLLPSLKTFLSVGEVGHYDEQDELPLPNSPNFADNTSLSSHRKNRIRADPKINIVLFCIKVCIIYFIPIILFSIFWNVALYGTDDYNKKFTFLHDPHKCEHHNSNSSECLKDERDLYCKWTRVNASYGRCRPYFEKGLDDLSMSNVTPRNYRLWLSGIFALIFGCLTSYTMWVSSKKMNRYVGQVVKEQAIVTNTIGYRTVVITGLDVPLHSRIFGKKVQSNHLASVDDFKNYYLNSGTYFKRDILDRISDKLSYSKDQLKDYTVRLGGLMGHFCAGGKLFKRDELVLFEQAETTSDGHFVSTKAEAIVIGYSTSLSLFISKKRYQMAKSDFQNAIARENCYHRDLKIEREICNKLLLADKRSDLCVPVIDATFPPLKKRSCSCQSVEVVENAEENLRKMAALFNEDIKKTDKNKPNGTVFITFKDAASAYEFNDMFNQAFGGFWSFAKSRIAGPYKHIEKQNLEKHKWLCYAISFVYKIGLIVLALEFGIIVAFLSSFNNLASIPMIGYPFLEMAKHLPPLLMGIIVAYLPTIVFALLDFVIPYVIRFFVILSGSPTVQETENRTMIDLYIFLFISGILLPAISNLTKPSNLWAVINNPQWSTFSEMFVTLCSPSGGYWFAFVINGGCLAMWVSALYIGTILPAWLLGKRVATQKVYNSLYTYQEFEFDQTLSRCAFFASIGFLFSFTVPLISIFIGIYFVNSYVTFRGCLIDAYESDIELSELVTNFKPSCTFFRILASMYFFGSFCMCLVVGFKRHWGGFCFTVINLVLSFVCLCYIVIKSRKWVPSTILIRDMYYEYHNSEDTAEESATKQVIHVPTQDKEIENKQKDNSAAVEVVESPSTEASLGITQSEDQTLCVPNKDVEEFAKMKRDKRSNYSTKFHHLTEINIDDVIAECKTRTYRLCMYWHGMDERRVMQSEFEKKLIKNAKKMEKDIHKSSSVKNH